MKTVQFNGINSPQQTKVEKTVSSRPNAPSSATTNVHKDTDSVSVSPRAEEVSRLVAKARELPDTRQERVAHLKHLIDSGQYHVSSKKIADAILADEK